MVHFDTRTVYTPDNVCTSRDVIDEVECSESVVPEAIYSLVDPKALVGKVNTILVDALNPVVLHLYNHPSAKVEFDRKTYEDPSDSSECPEIFILSKLFLRMKN